MKNEYRVDGDRVIILLKRKDGSTAETIIDKSDFEIVSKFPNTWFAAKDHGRGVFYVTGNTTNCSGKETSIRLHRVILNPPPCMVIDHINGNPLDNTRANMRVITSAQNSQNQKGAMKNNLSCGLRGVTTAIRGGKTYWRASVQVNGKKKILYTGKDLSLAFEKARKAREVLMPYSQEALGR